MSEPTPKSRFLAVAIAIGAVMAVGAVPVVATVAAVAVLDPASTGADPELRAALRRPFFRRVDRVERERESAPINWRAATETKGQTYRRVPCASCPSGYRLVPVPQVSPRPVPQPQRPQRVVSVPRPITVTPAELGLPPGSRIVSVTERVIRPQHPQSVTPILRPHQSPVSPHDEVKTGAYLCPHCKHHHIGSEMHSLTTPDGEPVPVLCERCWSHTSQAQRAEYVRAELLRQAAK